MSAPHAAAGHGAPETHEPVFVGPAMARLEELGPPPGARALIFFDTEHTEFGHGDHGGPKDDR